MSLVEKEEEKTKGKRGKGLELQRVLKKVAKAQKVGWKISS